MQAILNPHYCAWRYIDRLVTNITITITKITISFSLDRFLPSGEREFKSLKQRIATSATKNPKAPVAFHSQVFRCFRLAIAPITLPDRMTEPAKIKNENNDMNQSVPTTLSKSLSPAGSTNVRLTI